MLQARTLSRFMKLLFYYAFVEEGIGQCVVASRGSYSLRCGKKDDRIGRSLFSSTIFLLVSHQANQKSHLNAPQASGCDTRKRNEQFSPSLLFHGKSSVCLRQVIMLSTFFIQAANYSLLPIAVQKLAVSTDDVLFGAFPTLKGRFVRI